MGNLGVHTFVREVYVFYIPGNVANNRTKSSLKCLSCLRSTLHAYQITVTVKLDIIHLIILVFKAFLDSFCSSKRVSIYTILARYAC